jgi:hypothetical protein
MVLRVEKPMWMQWSWCLNHDFCLTSALSLQTFRTISHDFPPPYSARRSVFIVAKLVKIFSPLMKTKLTISFHNTPQRRPLSWRNLIQSILSHSISHWSISFLPQTCYTTIFVVFSRQHNNKNTSKLIELLTLVLFDSCYMFRSTFATIFRQSHQIHLLLLNCPNMDPC